MRLPWWVVPLYGFVTIGPALLATIFEVPPQTTALGRHVDNGGRLQIAIQKLHLTEGTADLFVNLVAPPFFVDTLVGPDRKPVTQDPPSGNPQPIAKAYSNAHVDLVLQNPGQDITSPNFTRKFVIPLADFTNGAGYDSVYSQTIDGVQLATATPGQFPIDSYRLHLWFHLLLSDGMSVRVGTSYYSEVLVQVYSVLGAPLTDMSVDEGPDSSASSPTHGYSLELILSRRWQDRLFVLGVALSPLILALWIGFRLWTGRTRVDSVSGWVTGLGAIALAVLPVRAVLVPGELATLTIVDFSLAGALILLAGLVIYVSTG